MDSNEGANNTDMEAPGPETNSSTKSKPAFIWKLHEHLPPTLLRKVPFYMAAQMTGSMIASFTLRELLSPITNIGTTTPSGTNFQAFVMEVVVTFSMMFVTSAVATDTKAIGELAGIAVGSAVTITSILAGPISGGSMNPARTIGPAIASKRYKGVWVYVVGPIVGTMLGSWSYNFIRESASDDKALDTISEGSSSCCFKIRHHHHHRPSQERQQLQADTTTRP